MVMAGPLPLAGRNGSKSNRTSISGFQSRGRSTSTNGSNSPLAALSARRSARMSAESCCDFSNFSGGYDSQRR